MVWRFRRFRQRVADPALTLAPWVAPEWADDAGFALADHVSRTRLPAPGDQGALQQAASDLAGRPLRKDRPLWELHLLDGYGDGGALLLRTHHAIADGGALIQVLLALADPLEAGEHPGMLPVHDDTAGPPLLPGPGGRTAGRAMAAARRAGSAAGDLSAVLRAALADPRKAAGLAGSARADAAMLRKLGFGLTAGRNLLQGPLGLGKQRAWTRSVPVNVVKAAAAATGSTVNDLMLTAITSALRRYLLEHDAPADEVIVIVPVNLRPAGASLPAGLGNQFGLAFVRLPTGETDQGRRRARVKTQMDQVKSSREGVFVYTMLQWMGQLPAAVQNAWVDAFAGKATAIVTNVSGPPHRVQIAGTPAAGMAGWVPVTGPLLPVYRVPNRTSCSSQLHTSGRLGMPVAAPLRRNAPVRVAASASGAPRPTALAARTPALAAPAPARNCRLRKPGRRGAPPCPASLEPAGLRGFMFTLAPRWRLALPTGGTGDSWNSYDVVVSNLAFANIHGEEERAKALREAVRVLRPGGRMRIVDDPRAGRYADVLRAAGCSDVEVRRLDWRTWFGLPGHHLVLVAASKPAADTR